MNTLVKQREITPRPKHPPVNMQYRRLIAALEKKIISLPGAMINDPFPLKHIFAEGVYMRELTIPKGMFLVGKLHKHSYVNCFMKGDMTILTEKGIKRIKAPCSIISPDETKRFGYSHEEVTWVTVHPNPTNTTDIEELEKGIHAEDYEDLPNQVIDMNPEMIEMTEKVFYDFIKHIFKFNVEDFRELTKKVFAHEKPGFWSDWTKEQQELYMSGDWEAFSRSRDYTEEEIADLKLWIYMREEGEKQGYAPLKEINDLSLDTALKNIAMDKKGEILKSSHIPSSKKVPYESITKGGTE